MSERDENSAAQGTICCHLDLKEEGHEPEIVCGDPECNGKVHWVYDGFELACKRSGGIPGNFGSDCVAITPRKDRS